MARVKGSLDVHNGKHFGDARFVLHLHHLIEPGSCTHGTVKALAHNEISAA